MTYRPYTVDELITMMWEDSLDHRYIGDTDELRDCTCELCAAISVVSEYLSQGPATTVGGEAPLRQV